MNFVNRSIESPWLIVRSLAQLTILTRASYFMLLLVPVIAGLWPSIDRTIQSYEVQFVLQAEKLRIAAETLSIGAEGFDGSQAIAASTAKLDEVINQITRNRQSIQALNPRMPKVWALAFLASLSAVLAQVLFQACCDRRVQDENEQEFVANELLAFNTHPDHAELAFMAINQHLNSDELDKLARVVGETTFMQSYGWGKAEQAADPSGDIHRKSAEREGAKELIRKKATDAVQIPPDGSEGELQNKIVRRAAQKDYRQRAQFARPFGLTALTLYLIAVALLLWVIGDQTASVLGASFNN